MFLTASRSLVSQAISAGERSLCSIAFEITYVRARTQQRNEQRLVS
jgi:hypothetical protein